MPSLVQKFVSLPSRAAFGDGQEVQLRRNRFKTHLRLWKKWWLRPHAPFQPLFVIATWRSGSELLLSYLNQQPSVAVLGEVFCSWLDYGPSNECLPRAKAIRHIRYCLNGMMTTPIRGCKLILQHLTNCHLTLDHLNREFPAAKYIVLYRQSLPQQFVSHEIAQVTQQFLVHRGQTPRQAEIHVDAGKLKEYCDETRRRYQDVLACPWLQDKAVLLSYEELVADPTYWLKQQICPLLDLPFAAVQSKLVKQGTRPFAEQVTNYQNVKALLDSPLCRQQLSWPSLGRVSPKHGPEVHVSMGSKRQNS